MANITHTATRRLSPKMERLFAKAVGETCRERFRRALTRRDLVECRAEMDAAFEDYLATMDHYLLNDTVAA